MYQMKRENNNICFELPQFDGGINTVKYCTDIADNQLADCKNMWFNGGFLKTREGLKVRNIISVGDADNSSYDIRLFSDIKFTNTTSQKIYLLTKKSGNYIYHKLLLVKASGESSVISFYKYDIADYDYVTTNSVNCILISGKPSKGCGIYVLVGIFNSSNALVGRKIFELNNALNGVIAINKSEVYAPLVYVNGKGTKYNNLESTDINYPSPSFFEEYNMLNGGFRATYKTDGISSVFILPCKNLSEDEGETTIVKYTNANGVTYKWTIPYNEVKSDYIKVDDVTYCIEINRVAGKILTLGIGDAALALPYVDGAYNNFEILTYKKLDSDRIFRMRLSENYNSRVFLTGYKAEGNVVCFSKRNNPLYIPETNIAYFGDEISSVTAMKIQNDRLVLFKPYEIGICSNISFSNYNINLILTGKSANVNVSERMDIKVINSGIGCLYPETILNCANRLVFLGADKKVYTITSTSNYLQRIYNISASIESLLSESSISENAVAVKYRNNYILFLDNRAFLFDYSTADFANVSTNTGNNKANMTVNWYYFSFPLSVDSYLFSAVFINNTITLMCKIKDSYGYTSNIVGYYLSGNYDEIVSNDLKQFNQSIESSFTTKKLNLNSNGKKIINEIELSFGERTNNFETPIQIQFLDQDNFAYDKPLYIREKISGYKNVAKMISLPLVNSLGLKVTRDGSYSIKDIKLKYRKVN